MPRPQRTASCLACGAFLLVACATAPAEAPGAVPGGQPRSAQLAEELAAAVAARGPSYVPRTRHRREDGSPLFTNRLILESSPYLQQHAHNPVDWYPWGDEAFETARRLGRPVLLSIGYSTCHWCHVMEEESFEDLEVAAYLNAHYVAIKVDREERPDIDGIYMAAVQSLTGRGGWPMTTWLTPDRQPFFAGTYFPARDGDRGARKGFLTLLREMQAAYAGDPDRVAAQARQLTARVQQALAVETGPAASAEASLTEAARGYRALFDPENGGMRGAPKFPSSFPVRFLLREHRRTGAADLREMAVLTLEKMAAGGIHDQLAGGFHRYATDERWLVPHFEKMLYDNALLAMAYLEGFQATGRADFARVARDILDYVAREMTAPEGAFYSATDADSRTPEGEVEEGWFFTWTAAEIEAVLGREAAAEVAAFYGVTARGNFEGRNILYVPLPLEQAARGMGLPAEPLAERLAAARARLYRARTARPAPLRDDKILAAWNGLMVSAFARGGFVLAQEDLVERARKAADFLLTRMRVDGRLRRAYRDGAARQAGFLEDYAFTIAGLLDLYEATGERRWIAEAIELQRTLDAHHLDTAGGAYFLTAADQESLLAREKPAYDGAEPSGNSVALLNLLRLAALTSDDAYRLRAEGCKRAFQTVLARRPSALAEALLGLDFELSSPREVVIVAPERAQADALVDALRRSFVPGKVVVAVGERQAREQESLVPLLLGKTARKGLPTAYVCRRGVCQLPVTTAAALREQLGAAAR